MGKHVCPICEDVYAVEARADVKLGAHGETAEAWNCPHCGYEFVSVVDLRRLLEAATAPAATSVTTKLLGPSSVVWRENAASMPSATVASA